jgi:hypothetical protein
MWLLVQRHTIAIHGTLYGTVHPLELERNH